MAKARVGNTEQSMSDDAILHEQVAFWAALTVGKQSELISLQAAMEFIDHNAGFIRVIEGRVVIHFHT